MALKRQGKSRLPGSSGEIARTVWFVLLTAIATEWAASSPASARAPAQTEVPLVYNKGRNFRIPFNLNAEEKSRIKEVFLFVSEDSGYSWKSISRTFPDHPTFTYRAARDGEFWFTVQTRTLDGKVSPKLDSAVEPKMRVVVDTIPPLLTLEPDERRGSVAAVRWEIKDENLDAESLIIEYQVEGVGTWRKVPIRKLKLMGSQSWDTGTADAIKVRASVADLAGNLSEAKINLGEGTPNALEIGPDDQEIAGFGQISRTSNGPDPRISTGPDFTPVGEGSTDEGRRTVNEDLQPGRKAGSDDRTPAQRNATGRSTLKPRPKSEDPSTTPAKPAPPRWDRSGDSRVATAPGTAPQGSTDLFHSPDAAPASDTGSATSRNAALAAANMTSKGPQAAAPPANSAKPDGTPGSSGSLLVANPRFKLAYAIEDAGPSGPATVELWITPDGGRTWIRRGEDPDRVTPVEVDLGGEGTYGLSLVARSASGLGDQPPAPGDPPQTWIEVDSTAPALQLDPVQIGTGANSGKIAISWRANDLHLSPKSVALLWRADKQGAAWQPFAEAQENTGQFIWAVPATVPPRFHIRAEAVDMIGHRGGAETTDLGPIIVDRSRPRSRIIGLDPNARAGVGTSSWPLR